MKIKYLYLSQTLKRHALSLTLLWGRVSNNGAESRGSCQVAALDVDFLRNSQNSAKNKRKGLRFTIKITWPWMLSWKLWKKECSGQVLWRALVTKCLPMIIWIQTFLYSNSHKELTSLSHKKPSLNQNNKI